MGTSRRMFLCHLLSNPRDEGDSLQQALQHRRFDHRPLHCPHSPPLLSQTTGDHRPAWAAADAYGDRPQQPSEPPILVPS